MFPSWFNKLINQLTTLPTINTCLSTDSKPTTAIFTELCYETDTQQFSLYDGVDFVPMTKLEVYKFIKDKKATQEQRVAASSVGSWAATGTFAAFVAPAACVIDSIDLVQGAAISASDTDYWTIAATNKGSDGSGNGAIVSKTTKTTGGAAMTAYKNWNLGTLDSAQTKLAAGDVVNMTLTKSGSATTLSWVRVAIKYTLL